MIGFLLVGVLAQSPAENGPGVDRDETPAVEAVADDLAAEPGSQWGVVTIAGGVVSLGLLTTSPPLSAPRTSPRATGLSGIAGIGARYGLKPRVADQRMLMPGISFVVGTTFQTDNFSPFVESRLELMSLSPGGALQPNFVFYGTSGLGTTPLGPLRLAIHKLDRTRSGRRTLHSSPLTGREPA